MTINNRSAKLGADFIKLITEVSHLVSTVFVSCYNLVNRVNNDCNIIFLLARLISLGASLSIGTADLSNYVPAFGWECAPPTEKQIARLEKLGIFPDEIGNAGKAKLILDRLEKRRSEGLTTPKQIRFLENRGFQHVGTWQFESAKKIIDRIAANGWKIPNGINPESYTGENNG